MPIADLKAPEFLLTDNGVVQVIDSTSVEAVPVDVTLVIDISGSASDQLAAYRRDVLAISRLLRPIDRFRLMTFDALVHEVSPLAAAGDPPKVDRLETGSFTSIYDGLAAAMMRTTELNRRHLIVTFTDGLENWSVMTGDHLRQVAKRSEAVVHLISPKPWIPVLPDALPSHNLPRSALQDAVEATGGALHHGVSMVEDFKKVFRDFVASYVLRFTPTGVDRSGWHELSVKVVRKGRYTVHARRGYFGDSK